MNKPRFVIGLDGGGTKTVAELCDPKGAVLAGAQGGASNFQVIGVEPAARAIVDLIETCCHTVGCSVGDIGSVVAGLTGAGRAVDQGRMADALVAEIGRREISLRRPTVESDARIALEGAFNGGPGIIVIAGTGSIVFGKDALGTVHRGGGWGRLIGDEGSGYAIGRDMFRAVAAAIDGRGPETSLIRLLTAQHRLATQEAIIAALYRENFDIASVAPLVTKAAEKGDRVARRILAEAADDIVGVILAVARRMRGRRGSANPVAFVGSVLSHENFYSRRVRASIRRSGRRLVIRQPASPPVHGASLLALRSLEAPLS